MLYSLKNKIHGEKKDVAKVLDARADQAAKNRKKKKPNIVSRAVDGIKSKVSRK